MKVKQLIDQLYQFNQDLEVIGWLWGWDGIPVVYPLIECPTLYPGDRDHETVVLLPLSNPKGQSL